MAQYLDPDDHWDLDPEEGHWEDRAVTGLTAGVLLSLILHLLLVLAVVAGLFKSARPFIAPEQVVTVRLLGEVPKITLPSAEPLFPPETAAGEDETSAAAPAAIPKPTPPEATADGRPLGPKAEAKPPEIKKRKAPPPEVTPPEVTEARPKPPAPKVARNREARPRPKTDSAPRNVYDLLNRSLGRDTVAQTLGTPKGDRVDQDIWRYYQRVMVQIRASWNPPPGVSTRLQVRYIWNIETDGRITGIRLMNTSGNREYDRSVEQALRRASPLPALPPAFGGKRHPMDIWFRPERE